MSYLIVWNNWTEVQDEERGLLQPIAWMWFIRFARLQVFRSPGRLQAMIVFVLRGK